MQGVGSLFNTWCPHTYKKNQLLIDQAVKYVTRYQQITRRKYQHTWQDRGADKDFLEKTTET